MKLVSIVVPVYNVESPLNKCIKSLIFQTYTCIEIILINDGSSDNSGRVCDLYAKKDSRIKVIHQENKGAANARNVGIRECKGEIILFVDGDDWIDDRYVEVAVQYFNSNKNVDIVIEGMVWSFPDGHEVRQGIIGTDYLYSHNQAIDELLKFTYFTWGVSGKAYRKKLFKDFVIDERTTIGEDLDCNWVLFNRARRVYYTCKCDYHYFQYHNSATHLQDYAFDNSYSVFERILNSSNSISHYSRDFLQRFVLRLLAKKVRAMYLLDPMNFERNIDSLCQRFDEFAGLYPDIFANKKEFESSLRKDKEVRDKLFIDEYHKISDSIKEARKYTNIFIYGIGVAAEMIYRQIRKEKIELAGFVVSDFKYSESSFLGYDVLKISQINKSNNNVFIMSIRNSVRKGVVSELKKIGHNNVIEFDLNSYIYCRID